MPRKKKKKRSWWGTALKIVLASKVALLGAYYIGAKNPGPVRRLEDSLLYRSVPIAKDSFPDPAGLEVITEINGYGAKEVYLVHGESGRRWSIGYDLLPKDLRVIERGLEQRLSIKRIPYTSQETCERLDALIRRIDREHREYLAQYDSYNREISDINDSIKHAPYESCKKMIALARHVKRVIGEHLAQYNNYITEFSEIHSRSADIPPGTYEMVIAPIRRSKRMVGEHLAQHNLRIEELSVLMGRVCENQKL